MKVNGVHKYQVEDIVDISVDPVDMLNQLLFMIIPSNVCINSGNIMIELPDGYYETKVQNLGLASNEILELVNCGNKLRSKLEELPKDES